MIHASAFLDPLPFLDDDARARLRSLDLDEPDAVAAYSADKISELSGLSPGKAGRLLTAARAVLGAVAQVAPSPRQVRRDALRAALRAAEADPTPARLRAIAEVDPGPVVLLGDDRPSEVHTVAMREAMDAGAPQPATWLGNRVAAAADLGRPPAFLNPRTGRPLQAGRDELSGVAWGDLGIDGLRVAAFGYGEGMFDSVPEEVVFETIRSGRAGRVRDRMRATGVDPATLDGRVLLGRDPTRLDPIPSRREPSPVRTAGSREGRLADLLCRMFSAGEMRRLAPYLLGPGSAADLPGDNASLATLAAHVATSAIRLGRWDRGLRDALVAERPRRADEVDAVLAL